jgi:hypothetical protein
MEERRRRRRGFVERCNEGFVWLKRRMNLTKNDGRVYAYKKPRES